MHRIDSTGQENIWLVFEFVLLCFGSLCSRSVWCCGCDCLLVLQLRLRLYGCAHADVRDFRVAPSRPPEGQSLYGHRRIPLLKVVSQDPIPAPHPLHRHRALPRLHRLCRPPPQAALEDAPGGSPRAQHGAEVGCARRAKGALELDGCVSELKIVSRVNQLQSDTDIFCSFGYLFICLFVCLFVYLFTYMSV
jgi:hypothetical protein